MNAAAIDRILAAPRGGHFSASAARLRQVATLAQIIRTVDATLEEAFEAKIAAPGFIEIREWAAHGIEELVIAAERNIAAKGIPADPVKDACHDAMSAAVSGDDVAYAAARGREAIARAAAGQVVA